MSGHLHMDPCVSRTCGSCCNAQSIEPRVTDGWDGSDPAAQHPNTAESQHHWGWEGPLQTAQPQTLPKAVSTSFSPRSKLLGCIWESPIMWEFWEDEAWDKQLLLCIRYNRMIRFISFLSGAGFISLIATHHDFSAWLFPVFCTARTERES